MQNPETRMRLRRPLGVTLIACLEAFEAIILILVGIGAFIALSQVPSNAHISGLPASVATAGARVIVGFIGGASLFFGLLALIFTWGLWTLKRWAFWLTVAFQIINLASGVVQLIQPGANTSTVIGQMIIPVILLLYFLIDSNVRAAFRV